MAEMVNQLKRMRTNQAGRLTKWVNKASQALLERRSKRHLKECLEYVLELLTSLEESHNLYCSHLDSENEYREATQWILPRRDAAREVALELEAALRKSSLPSVTEISHSESSFGIGQQVASVKEVNVSGGGTNEVIIKLRVDTEHGSRPDERKTEASDVEECLSTADPQARVQQWINNSRDQTLESIGQQEDASVDLNPSGGLRYQPTSTPVRAHQSLNPNSDLLQFSPLRPRSSVSHTSHLQQSRATGQQTQLQGKEETNARSGYGGHNQGNREAEPLPTSQGATHQHGQSLLRHDIGNRRNSATFSVHGPSRHGSPHLGELRSAQEYLRDTRDQLNTVNHVQQTTQGERPPHTSAPQGDIHQLYGQSSNRPEANNNHLVYRGPQQEFRPRQDTTTGVTNARGDQLVNGWAVVQGPQVPCDLATPDFRSNQVEGPPCTAPQQSLWVPVPNNGQSDRDQQREQARGPTSDGRPRVTDSGRLGREQSIDGWIDELIPEVETVLFDGMSGLGNQDRLIAYLVRVESEKGLPDMELPVFNGAAKSWPEFIERFYVQVHLKPGLTDTRRMDILQSHLSGEAQRLVQGIGYTGKCYAEALKELKRTFGHRNKVARAYLDAVTLGPVLESRNTAKLREFFVRVRDAIITLTKLHYTMDLKGTDILVRAAKRLPSDKVSSWNRFVARITKEREPNICDLRDWLQENLLADSNPYAVPYDRKEEKPKAKSSGREQPKQRQTAGTVWNTGGGNREETRDKKMNTDTSGGTAGGNREESMDKKMKADTGGITGGENREETREKRTKAYKSGSTGGGNRGETTDRKMKTCVLCQADHPLYKCSKFLEMDIPARREVVSTSRLCYNCLKPHKVRACTSTVRCRQEACGRKHHSLLHEFRSTRDNKESKPVYHAKSQLEPSQNTFFQLAEVYVMGNNGCIIPTVAVLDSGSQITLIDDSLADDLGLKGEKRSLVVKTINAQDTRPSRVVSLRMKSRDPSSNDVIAIRRAWTVAEGTFDCPAQELNEAWEHCKGIGISDFIDPSEVKLLVGIDNPEVHLQLEIRRGREEEPLAVRTKLGWSIMGVEVGQGGNETLGTAVNFMGNEDQLLSEQIKKFWETESFGTSYQVKQPMSAQDRRAVEILEQGTSFIEGHYQVPMLWKHDTVNLPDSKPMAERRYESLLRRFRKDPKFKELYCTTMETYIEKGWATRLTEEEARRATGKTWYLPHFGVTSEHKPGKIRIVFDAAAATQGTSLNDNLMSGPDMLNNLFGILQRFRLFEVTFSADIESMFHMVKVCPGDADALRFLWKRNPEEPGPPETWQMNVHIFGAVDSPACANYALRRTAMDGKEQFRGEVIEAVLGDFYVDDLHKSFESTKKTIKFATEVIELTERGGFRLHKCVSNSCQVLSSIATSEKAVQEIDFDKTEAPVQRTLGIRWNIREDHFLFVCRPKEMVLTKRGVVSLLSSVYDPCGFISPFTVRGKFFIQEVWRSGIEWDDPLPRDLEKKWETWCEELGELTSFKLPRHHQHFTPQVQRAEVHIFCDASEQGFGAVGYLKYTVDNRVVTSFLAAKTHVAPLKTISIPRLELQGAVLAVRLGQLLKVEIRLGPLSTKYWTDSMIVLQYLRNRVRRFKPFVANRVTEILEETDVEDWHYVASECNPADHCTRGLPATALTPMHIWFTGPGFLRNEVQYKDQIMVPELPDGDPETKRRKATVLNAISKVKEGNETTAAQGQEIKYVNAAAIIDPNDVSTWCKLIRKTAWINRAVRNFRASKQNGRSISGCNLSVEELKDAEMFWVRRAQQEAYTRELESLRNDEPLDSKSSLLPLSPMYDEKTGTLRVGGRLRKAVLPEEAKHQQIIPRDHRVTHLLAADAHWRTMHGGQEHVISELRRRFWPVNARIVSRRAMAECVVCRLRRAKPRITKMADLPRCRVDAAKGPFYYTGIDYFGPMLVKIRRNTSIKRWGCLFTCLSTRAVHIELADSLETDHFILCLRNFIARRGQPSEIHSDNGTNFRGADEELKQCLRKLDQRKIQAYLAPLGIRWIFNPPLAPHWGGAWERLVGSVKRALKATLGKMNVTESVLRTALIETEGVLNSRPLTQNSSDPNDFDPITPNHFLLGRSDNNIPPDRFEDREIDSKRRWRQSQVVADRINRRWLREYLPNLTVRQQWKQDQRNVSEGDLVVLIDEDSPRKHWEMGRIIETFKGDDDVIRAVKVKTSRNVFTRPVTKVAVLEENVNSDK